MPDYTDHLIESYPYVTAAEMIARCTSAAGLEEDDEDLLDAIADASTVLYYLTGRQFHGQRQATVRPPCLPGACSCEFGCNLFQTNLGLWPVTELISVKYDGTTYTGSDLTDTFHVNNWRFLARNDGDRLVPGNQWARTDGDHDTLDDGYVFEVTFNYGLKIPSLLKRATRALACEWISQVAGLDGPCKLPERVTTVTRSGITMDVTSAIDMLQSGRTGIYQVDLAIQTFNPSKLQSPSFVWSGQSSYNAHRIRTDG